MNSKHVLVLSAGIVVLIGVFTLRSSRKPFPNSESVAVNLSASTEHSDAARPTRSAEAAMNIAKLPRRHPPAAPSEELPGGTNKLERLTQIRQLFHSLAKGDPGTALGLAKQITDPTERETALLSLVTEWTHGELRSPLDRANDISLHRVEAGLGMELANNPELAVLWANELTAGAGRTALLAQTAIGMTAADPSAAFALSDQLPEKDRRRFFDTVFGGWAEKDTGAAIDWANQLPDPAARDAATQAIRSVAPVGIGAALRMDDGYAVINQLFP